MKNRTDIGFTKNRTGHQASMLLAQQGWHKEFLESGAQFKMTFSEFKKLKRKELKKKK
jgi:hypothetical protein